MKLKNYIRNVTLPFCSSIDANNPIKTSEFQNGLAEFVRINYGKLYVMPDIVDETLEDLSESTEYTSSDYADAKTEINAICENSYLVNAYKYERLYATTVAQYDPLENYRMVESGADTRSYAESTSNTQGEQENSSSDSKTVGSQTNSGSKSNVLGSQSNSGSTSNTFGQQTTTTDNTDSKKVQPFNSGALVNAEQNITDGSTTVDSHTDSSTSGETIGGRTDSETTSETLGSHSDSGSHSETLGERTDSGSKSGSDNNSHSLTRYGNIGVTTSQQMIEAERQVALFNLYSVVANDFLKQIAVVVY